MVFEYEYTNIACTLDMIYTATYIRIQFKILQSKKPLSMHQELVCTVQGRLEHDLQKRNNNLGKGIVKNKRFDEVTSFKKINTINCGRHFDQDLEYEESEEVRLGGFKEVGT